MSGFCLVHQVVEEGAGQRPACQPSTCQHADYGASQMCGAPAVEIDTRRGMAVCAEHADGPERFR